MRKTSATIFLSAVLSSSGLVGQTTVSTPIVGFEKNSLSANSVYAYGSSLLFPPTYAASITSVGSDTVTFTGSDNIGSKLIAGEPYYLEITSGPAEGSRLDLVTADTIGLGNNVVKVLGNSANNTDTLAAVGVDLTNQTAVIRKHNTIKDIGDRISNLTAGVSGTGDEILLLNPGTGSFVTYLRRTSTSWRDGNNITVNTNVVPPGVGVIIRKRANAGEVLTSGQVRGNKFQLNTSSGNQLLALGYPINYSFAQIGATNTAAGWTFGTAGDQFFVLNPSGAFSSYLFRTSTSWRDGNNVNVTTNEILQAGSGYVLFKNVGENYLFNPPQ